MVLNIYLLSFYSVSGTVLGTGDKSVNNTDMNPALQKCGVSPKFLSFIWLLSQIWSTKAKSIIIIKNTDLINYKEFMAKLF